MYNSLPLNDTISVKLQDENYKLLKARVSLDALELIEKSQKKKPNKDILNVVSNDIVSGQSLSEALKGHKHLSNYEFHSIKIGEESVTLSQVIDQLGNFFARKND